VSDTFDPIQHARSLGYSEEELRSVPEGLVCHGCGNPVALAELQEGATTRRRLAMIDAWPRSVRDTVARTPPGRTETRRTDDLAVGTVPPGSACATGATTRRSQQWRGRHGCVATRHVAR